MTNGSEFNRITTWSTAKSIDFRPIRAHLPTVEESLIQVGLGRFEVAAEFVATQHLTLVHYFCEPLAVGISVFDSEHSAFVLPISWTSEFRVNGAPAESTSLYTPTRDGLFLRGERRELLAVVFRLRPVIDAVAALTGTDPAPNLYVGKTFSLGINAARHLRQELLRFLDLSQRLAYGLTAAQFENEVLTLAIDACLQSRPVLETKRARGYPRERIVRLVEERFNEAGGTRVSLADLCRAAHVSKSTLYSAFNDLFGEAPLAYLHKRKLNDARSYLLQSPSYKGSVKDAAIKSGLTELGRFSNEYRLLFGEAPSVTLSRAGEERPHDVM